MNLLRKIGKIVIPVWIALILIAAAAAAFYPRPFWKGWRPDILDIIFLCIFAALFAAYFVLLTIRLRNIKRFGKIELAIVNPVDRLSFILIYILLACCTFLLVDYILHPGKPLSVVMLALLILSCNNYTACYHNGLGRGGAFISGYFYPWGRVAAYATLNDTVYLLIRRRRAEDPRLLERPIVSLTGEDIVGYLESRGIRRRQPEGSY